MILLFLALSPRPALAMDDLTVWFDGTANLLITEVNARPKSPITDKYGEWFEVYNLGADDVDLGGLKLVDDSGSHTLTASRASSGSLVLARGEYMIFGRSTDTAQNGGVAVDYQYPTRIWLEGDAPYTADAIALYDGSSLVAYVEWSDWTLAEGTTLEVDLYSYELADDPLWWCGANSAFSSGNLGTPGADNDPCEFDDDGDGYEKTATGGDDCDDTDADVNPGADEVWYDGVDQDCDGASDDDADGDGYDAVSAGGDDCDDADAAVHPGAPDEPESGTRPADAVSSEDQGQTNGGADVEIDRSLSSAALTLTEADEVPYSFYSLGMGGSLIVSFSCPLVDGDGDDLKIYEKTYRQTDDDCGSSPEESALIEVWDGVGLAWVVVDEIDNLPACDRPNVGTGLDLAGLGLPASGVRYVRITDTTDGSLHDATADGFDVNGIYAMQACAGECDGIDNDCDGTADGGFSDTDEDGTADCVDLEECDGLDNDGDGLVDEGFTDTDMDGLADCVDCEECDGLDNDGDGITDEGFQDRDGDGLADCVDDEFCDDCSDNVCEWPEPSTCEEICETDEVCDGADNDGDGSIDEDFPDTDGDGIADCMDCETCDDIDNNGDTQVDEGFSDTDGDGSADCVSCEVCDGLDNDGDDVVDEGFQDLDGDGVADCVDDDFCAVCSGGGCIWPEPDPGAGICETDEVCDGADNDGDGSIDEDFPDTDGDGIADCMDCETCDNIDNNGNGLKDEGFPDTDGDGIADCVDTEECDGLDNNGNGVIDEGFPDTDGDGIADCVDTEECDGLDNDGDGQIDEGFDTNGNGYGDCMECVPSTCNGDAGYGSKCASKYNTKGCDEDLFEVWCERRASWSDYLDYREWHYDWIDTKCDGTIVLHNEQKYSNFPGKLKKEWYTCTDTAGRNWYCKTPLVVVLPGHEIELVAAGGWFDLGGLALDEQTDWPRADTPWLVLDRNGDGRINSGAELFGSGTKLRDGRTARHGFEALAELDDNGDGWIDAQDRAWTALRLWADVDADRRSSTAELRPLSSSGVSALSLRWSNEPRCDAQGNCEVERADIDLSEAWPEGAAGALVDVHLAVRDR